MSSFYTDDHTLFLFKNLYLTRQEQKAVIKNTHNAQYGER